MDDHDRYVYLKLLEEVRRRFGVRVYAFCLMGNHVHLMIQTGEVHLSVVMKFINMRFAVFVNRKYGLVGHVFQGRFRSKMVMDLGYARELMRYIHMNPVAAGLVDVELGLGLFGGQVGIFLKFVGSDPCEE
jgi:REP element-mobilizing transposase RayT